MVSDTAPAGGGDTISIAGKKVKKTTAGIAALAIVGVIIYARKKSATATAATATTAATFTDPAGNSCAAANPTTGYCPGTAEDTAALAQLSASGQSSTYTAPVLGGGSGGTSGGVPAFLSNGDWGTYAEQALGSDGTDATAAAIAKYLGGSQLTSTQVSTVEEAIAIANYPPVSGPGGFPPSMHVAAAAPAPAPSPAAGQVTVPKVTGMSGAQAVSKLDASHLRGQLPAGRHGTYTVSSQNPAAGRQVAAGTIVELGIHEQTGKK